jgi:hypothetical protein
LAIISPKAARIGEDPLARKICSGADALDGGDLLLQILALCISVARGKGGFGDHCLDGFFRGGPERAFVGAHDGD